MNHSNSWRQGAGPVLPLRSLHQIADRNDFGLPPYRSAGDPDYLIENGVLSTYMGNREKAAIPQGVKVIREFAFLCNEHMTHVRYPSSLWEIGKGAFEGCTRLKKISIPDNVFNIRQGAFRNCTALVRAELGSGVTALRRETFAGCTSLISVCLPESLRSIERGAFQGCSSLSGITIPSGVRFIEEGAFRDCPLRVVAFPGRKDFDGIQEKALLRAAGRCQHCGGAFDGTHKCIRCGLRKDYRVHERGI